MIVVFEMFLLQIWASQAYRKAESRDLTDTLIRHGSHSKTRGTVATSTHDLHVSFLLIFRSRWGFGWYILLGISFKIYNAVC